MNCVPINMIPIPCSGVYFTSEHRPELGTADVAYCSNVVSGILVYEHKCSQGRGFGQRLKGGWDKYYKQIGGAFPSEINIIHFVFSGSDVGSK